MNRVISTLALGVLVSSCGQLKVSIPSGKPGVPATVVTISTEVVSSALGDVQSCPVGMTLIPSGVGNSAYCIDSLPSATGSPIVHSSAISACQSAGKTLCSLQQLSIICGQGTLNAAYMYWTNEITGGAGPVILATAYNGATCSSPGSYSLATNPVKQYYCCSR